MISKLKRIGAALVFALLLPRTAGAAEKVSFALNWIPYGLHLGVYAAAAEGFYKAKGIDIHISRGFGSGDTAKRIAAGAEDFGLADADSVILARAKGLPLKMVAMILARSPDIVYYLKGKGIKTLKDLAGHSAGTSVGGAPLLLFPALAKAAGLDRARVRLVYMPPSAFAASLASGRVDALFTFATLEPSIMKAAREGGVKIGKFPYSDYGIDPYSVGVVTNDATIKNHPRLVRRVVAATIEGYAWAVQNPAAAAALFVKRFPSASAAVTEAQFAVVLRHMMTPLTQKEGLGSIDRKKMARTIALIDGYAHFQKKPTPKEVYTMKFLPFIAAKGN